MFFPETWGFWESRHSAKDRDNVAMRYRGFSLLIDPPTVKSPVQVDEEHLFRRGCFSKRVRDVCAGDGIEDL
jgi:hypothetical protein